MCGCRSTVVVLSCSSAVLVGFLLYQSSIQDSHIDDAHCPMTRYSMWRSCMFSIVIYELTVRYAAGPASVILCPTTGKSQQYAYHFHQHHMYGLQ